MLLAVSGLQIMKFFFKVVALFYSVRLRVFFQHVTRKMIFVRWPKTFLILLTLMLAYQQLLQATLYLECHSLR